jgi:hypothetical protein
LSSPDPELGGHIAKIGKGLGFHFLHDPPAVCLDP